MGGIGILQLLIIVLIVVLLFGTNKLRGLGADLGASIKGFKKAISDDNEKQTHDHDADFDARLTEKKPQVETRKEDIKNDKV